MSEIEDWFGPGGLLAKKVERFEYRESQLRMACAVLECIEAGEPLMVEAGTGTGKTWAYLVPAILSGRTVVISTGTKTLQDQVVDRDIPFLSRLIAPKPRAVCLKGRRNYLCRRRFREFTFQPTFWNKDEAKLYRKFQRWAAKSPTGDRSEVDWLPENFHTWNEVNSHTDHCLGQQCDDHGRCHLTRLRADASRAKILVVNHHLFFADLSLRMKGLGEVLPDYDAVIFDEAHQLEDIISQYFGLQFGTPALNELARDSLKEARREPRKTKRNSAVQNISQQLEGAARMFHHNLLRAFGGQGRFALELGKAGKGYVELSNQVILALDQLTGHFPIGGEETPAGWEHLHRRCREVSGALQDFLEQRDEGLVYWVEVGPSAAFIHGTPVDVASVLSQKLLPAKPALTLTSATLTIAGSFDYVRGSLGLPPEAHELALPSPFEYDRQALLYVPPEFPMPSDPAFCERLADESYELLRRTRGRALFLFTSYRNMKEVHQRLSGRLPYPMLMQGEKPNRVLLAEFTEKVDSVLLATNSFWQGIDVPGEALSCLLIDKLPFEVPDDPVIAARMEYLAAGGKNAFFAYQVPRAAIQLKQGAGRLIRSSTDRGIIAIFDRRLRVKPYGKVFLKSLPPCRQATCMADVDQFLVESGM